VQVPGPSERGQAPRGRVRLKDLALRAGVSVNTVSRAIRAPDTVRPELRRRIEALLDELDYVPNRLAGGLAGSRTRVVGVIVTSLFYSEFAALIDALQAELSHAGYSVMLGNSDYRPEEELRLVRTMLSWQPAAVALIGLDHHPRAVELLQRAGRPVVELWEAADRRIDSAVGMDHRVIGASQAAHLMAEGFARLAFVGSVRPHDHRARHRRDGFLAAVAEAGLAAVEATSPEGGTADLGEALLERLLGESPQVDGIACNSDVIAFGVLRGLARRGRRVPAELGVIGFGDNEAAACMTPPLSTMRPPRAAIGRAAADVLLARIDGAPPVQRTFEASLVVRASTARNQTGQGTDPLRETAA
jgi:LacI family gluconate utilization system Gnt-I transcriptional repressor